MSDIKVFPTNGTDFSRYRTYEWLPPRVLTKAGLIENDPTYAPLMERAFKEQLAKKGITEQPNGADMQVSAFAMAESMPHMEILFSPNYTITWGEAPLATVSRYVHKGTLAVNLIDPRTQRSIWIGLVTKVLKSPENREKNINKGVADLLRKYPGP